MPGTVTRLSQYWLTCRCPAPGLAWPRAWPGPGLADSPADRRGLPVTRIRSHSPTRITDTGPRLRLVLLGLSRNTLTRNTRNYSWRCLRGRCCQFQRIGHASQAVTLRRRPRRRRPAILKEHRDCCTACTHSGWLGAEARTPSLKLASSCHGHVNIPGRVDSARRSPISSSNQIHVSVFVTSHEKIPATPGGHVPQALVPVFKTGLFFCRTQMQNRNSLARDACC